MTALFWKAAAAVLITTVLALSLGRQDMALVLTMTVCAMVSILALTVLEPVLDFLRELEALGQIQGDMLGLLLKGVGIGLTAELAAIVCTDGGNASLGKSIQLLGSAAILCLSLPIFRAMLDLIRQILGEL